MADKLYIKASNLVTFIAGERPSADKFNAMGSYFSRALTELSVATGDIYDSGFPHLTNADTYLTYKWNVFQSGNREGRPLDILNLARLIGPASNLNPRMLSRDNNTITETVPVGVSEYHTKYKMTSGLSAGITGLINALSAELTISSSYYVDVANSKIIFSEATTEEHEITYTSDNTQYYGGPNYLYSEFNVIPDPNSTAILTITENVDGTYNVVLPTVTAQQSGLNNLQDVEVATPDEPNNALQIKLPKWITETNPSALFSGDNTTLPKNTIYLKNRTTGETYINATYEYVSEQEVKVSGVELCLDEGHVFCLICVGTDITTSIDDLRVKWFKHSHDGSFGEPRISIKHLADKFSTEAPSGIYGESGNGWNPLANYLHRDGWVADSNNQNGDNAMRGSLLMGLASFDPISQKQIHGIGESQGVYFGDISSFIKRLVDNTLLMFNGSGDVKLESFNNNIRVSSALDTIINTVNEYYSEAASTHLVNSNYYRNDIGGQNYIHGNSTRMIFNESHEVQDLSIGNLIAVNQNQNQINRTDSKNLNRVKGVYSKQLKNWIASWNPSTALELDGLVVPADPNAYTRVDYIDGSSSQSLYESLLGDWTTTISSGAAILSAASDSVELYKEELDACYHISFTEQVDVEGVTHYVTPQTANAFDIKFNRSINLYNIKDSLNEKPEFKSTYYIKVSDLPRDLISTISTSYTINLNYSGYITPGGEYTLDDTPGNIPLNLFPESLFILFNGEKIDTSDPVWNVVGTPNRFQENTLYKIEETYFEGKIWLEITG